MKIQKIKDNKESFQKQMSSLLINKLDIFNVLEKDNVFEIPWLTEDKMKLTSNALRIHTNEFYVTGDNEKS